MILNEWHRHRPSIKSAAKLLKSKENILNIQWKFIWWSFGLMKFLYKTRKPKSKIKTHIIWKWKKPYEKSSSYTVELGGPVFFLFCLILIICQCFKVKSKEIMARRFLTLIEAHLKKNRFLSWWYNSSGVTKPNLISKASRNEAEWDKYWPWIRPS